MYKIQKGKTCYSEEQVIGMLEILIDNIFVSSGGTVSAGRRHTKRKILFSGYPNDL
jgi:hypothetical protein